MKKAARSVALVAFAAAALSTTACTSIFPVGTFSWGHGAVPLKDGAVRVQAGGGGGAGLVGAFLPVAGGGGGAALEYQVNQALLLRVDGGVAAQTPGMSRGTLNYPYTMLGAGYLGGQLTMSKEHAFALRLRVGGGAEHSPATAGLDAVTIRYTGAEAKLVKSFVIDDNLEIWIDGGLGVKMPVFVGDELTGAPIDSLPTVLDVGIASGVARRIGDAGHVYASAQGGAVLLALPTPVASLQLGYTHTF